MSMRTIGILGGMSWESTLHYYRLMNEAVRERLGGLHSAPILLDSVDFAPIEAFMCKGEWDAVADILCRRAARLEKAGAELLVLATNTMHKLAPQIEACIDLPFLHIADATSRQINKRGYRTVGLLGTRATMEEEFYTARLAAQRLTALTPETKAERDEVHRIIFEELCLGIIKDRSRQTYEEIMTRLAERGAQAIILGCTEIASLVSNGPVPLIDTTAVHARAAVAMALDRL